MTFCRKRQDFSTSFYTFHQIFYLKSHKFHILGGANRDILNIIAFSATSFFNFFHKILVRTPCVHLRTPLGTTPDNLQVFKNFQKWANLLRHFLLNLYLMITLQYAVIRNMQAAI